jgi:tetratricopeptide (TPR) repeat protein
LQNPEELAQEALKFLEIAQKFEEDKNIEEAISNYQKAADFLKQSGFLMHRIQEIYDRIVELKDFIQKETLYRRTQAIAQVEQLQDRAFVLLEGAKKLEFDGFFEESIQQYLSAINLLVDAGWSESQLENLKLKINKLARESERRIYERQLHRKEPELKNEIPQVIPDEKPQVVGMFGLKSSIEKAAVLEKFKKEKLNEEKVQNEAFAHIDAAKRFEKDKKFDTAIKNYERAVELLNSIGWDIQTQKIHTIIEKLKKDKLEFETHQLEKPLELKSDIKVQKIKLEREAEQKKEKLIVYEKKKKHEEEIQLRAFNLIDIGHRLDREKRYDEAIDTLIKAVNLLRSIEWDSYIHPISNLIENVKSKQKSEETSNQLREKRQSNLKLLQDSIYQKQKEQLFESAKELDQKKKEFEEKRKNEVRKEEELFKILDKADKVLMENDFDEAINIYQKALPILIELGSGWEPYRSMVQNTISNVETLKHSQLTKQYEDQKKKEERRREELDFQKEIATQINKELERLKKKEIIFKDREEQLKLFEQEKKKAFEFLDSAIDFLKEGDYENTILNYQNAANIFAEIQWTEEIPVIENSIKEVQELKKKQNILKQKSLKERIERQKKDEEFQKQISKNFQLEREKLKKKKIELIEREKQSEFREEKRKAGFKLLEEAQNKVKEGNFDYAIEILQYAINFFADAQWHNEINLIQNAIVEIENKKKEKEIQDQIKFRSKLEREKQEKEFQERIKKEMEAQHQMLMRREIQVREKEQELAYREKKKQEAFDLLERAQDFLSKKKFDDALQIYYNIANIFAQIQWKEEIRIIQQAIYSIEEKKKQDQLNKQKLLQKKIKNRSEDRAFIENIKYQNERKIAEFLKKKEVFEKQKQLSAQNLAKQQKAFTLIESGDKFFDEENFNNTIANYNKAIDILKDIGWEERYLKLLNDTIQAIKIREKEKEMESQRNFEISLKQQKEDDLFQERIKESMLKEQKKLKEKEIQIEKREDLMKLMEKRKSEAFNIMDHAQNLLIQGEYEKSIENYLKAELILNEINFPTNAIREMISKIQEKKREEDLDRFKELEVKIRREKEEELFQEQILKKIKFEESKMRKKQEKLKKEEELKVIQQKEQEKAFNILENAQEKIEQEQYDAAIKLYKEAIDIFREIQWYEEIDLIEKSILVVEDKKREADLRRQQELQLSLEKEKQERILQEHLIKEMKLQSEELKNKQIRIREREKELAFREKRKEEAFDMLDNAQKNISLEQFDGAIELYHNVANIFAQIQWKEEIPIINKAIEDIEAKKREKDLLKQKLIKEAIEKEKENYAFMEKINELREKDKLKTLEERERFQQQELLTIKALEKEKQAFELIDKGYNLLHQMNYDDALLSYQNALNLLIGIGWTSDYLKLIQDNIKVIESRKIQLETKKEAQLELVKQRKYEDEKFQKRISDYMKREQDRLKAKKIEIQKQEKLKQIMQTRKREAFNVLDAAENAFNQKEYNQAIKKYREAELILNEIGFPTNLVREMIHKVQRKINDDYLAKQKNLEMQLQKAKEEFDFQQQLAKNIKINEMKLKVKQNEIEEQKKFHAYMENRKGEAFNLLEEAEFFMKQLQYDKALEYYYSAELILNEIAFPTNSIRELILKVQEKKRDQQVQKQKELKLSMQKEREEWEYQQKIAENIKLEQERLKQKELKTFEMEQMRSRLEKRREQAFKILEEGEKFLKQQNYDNAEICYRRAGIILNELHFPTDSINNMIRKINKMKEQEINLENLRVQKKLEKLEEERALSMLIEERRRQEREKKAAQELALQERERIIQEQKSVRESAYSLLDKAGTYLKQRTPNFNEAISLYIQARHLLAENLGWEPEIRNLNNLIQDLQQEQANFLEKKRLEKQVRLQRENEYAMFQEEVRRRRLEQERLKREQERQYRDLVIRRQQMENIRDEGLNLIDEGKKWAAYHDFERAYKNFNSAIAKFKAIGWKEEIKYIETEIKNTKNLQERVIKEGERIRNIQEQLEEQRYFKKKQREQEEVELKGTVGEVSELADDIMNLIEERRQEQKLAETEQQKKVETKAREFRKEMTNLIKVKQELMDEIAKKEVEKRHFQKRLEEAKEREKVDSLKKMIKEASEKKKK